MSQEVYKILENINFRKCSICNKDMQKAAQGPFLLPCLRSVCAVCKDDVTEINKHCTFCRERMFATIREDLIGRNHLLSSYVRRNLDMTLCSKQADDRKASCFCFNCRQFLCIECYNDHVTSDPSHEIVTMGNIVDLPVREWTENSNCLQHPGYPWTHCVRVDRDYELRCVICKTKNDKSEPDEELEIEPACDSELSKLQMISERLSKRISLLCAIMRFHGHKDALKRDIINTFESLEQKIQSKYQELKIIQFNDDISVDSEIKVKLIEGREYAQKLLSTTKHDFLEVVPFVQRRLKSLLTTIENPVVTYTMSARNSHILEQRCDRLGSQLKNFGDLTCKSKTPLRHQISSAIRIRKQKSSRTSTKKKTYPCMVLQFPNCVKVKKNSSFNPNPRLTTKSPTRATLNYPTKTSVSSRKNSTVTTLNYRRNIGVDTRKKLTGTLNSPRKNNVDSKKNLTVLSRPKKSSVDTKRSSVGTTLNCPKKTSVDTRKKSTAATLNYHRKANVDTKHNSMAVTLKCPSKAVGETRKTSTRTLNCPRKNNGGTKKNSVGTTLNCSSQRSVETRQKLTRGTLNCSGNGSVDAKKNSTARTSKYSKKAVCETRNISTDTLNCPRTNNSHTKTNLTGKILNCPRKTNVNTRKNSTTGTSKYPRKAVDETRINSTGTLNCPRKMCGDTRKNTTGKTLSYPRNTGVNTKKNSMKLNRLKKVNVDSMVQIEESRSRCNTNKTLPARRSLPVDVLNGQPGRELTRYNHEDQLNTEKSSQRDKPTLNDKQDNTSLTSKNEYDPERDALENLLEDITKSNSDKYDSEQWIIKAKSVKDDSSGQPASSLPLIENSSDKNAGKLEKDFCSRLFLPLHKRHMLIPTPEMASPTPANLTPFENLTSIDNLRPPDDLTSPDHLATSSDNLTPPYHLAMAPANLTSQENLTTPSSLPTSHDNLTSPDNLTMSHNNLATRPDDHTTSPGYSSASHLTPPDKEEAEFGHLVNQPLTQSTEESQNDSNSTPNQSSGPSCSTKPFIKHPHYRMPIYLRSKVNQTPFNEDQNRSKLLVYNSKLEPHTLRKDSLLIDEQHPRATGVISEHSNTSNPVSDVKSESAILHKQSFQVDNQHPNSPHVISNHSKTVHFILDDPRQDSNNCYDTSNTKKTHFNVMDNDLDPWTQTKNTAYFQVNHSDISETNTHVNKGKDNSQSSTGISSRSNEDTQSDSCLPLDMDDNGIVHSNGNTRKNDELGYISETESVNVAISNNEAIQSSYCSVLEMDDRGIVHANENNRKNNDKLYHTTESDFSTEARPNNGVILRSSCYTLAMDDRGIVHTNENRNNNDKLCYNPETGSRNVSRSNNELTESSSCYDSAMDNKGILQANENNTKPGADDANRYVNKETHIEFNYKKDIDKKGTVSANETRKDNAKMNQIRETGIREDERSKTDAVQHSYCDTSDVDGEGIVDGHEKHIDRAIYDPPEKDTTGMTNKTRMESGIRDKTLYKSPKQDTLGTRSMNIVEPRIGVTNTSNNDVTKRNGCEASNIDGEDTEKTNIKQTDKTLFKSQKQDTLGTRSMNIVEPRTGVKNTSNIGVTKRNDCEASSIDGEETEETNIKQTYKRLSKSPKQDTLNTRRVKIVEPKTRVTNTPNNGVIKRNGCKSSNIDADDTEKTNIKQTDKTLLKSPKQDTLGTRSMNIVEPRTGVTNTSNNDTTKRNGCEASNIDVEETVTVNTKNIGKTLHESPEQDTSDMLHTNETNIAVESRDEHINDTQDNNTKPHNPEDHPSANDGSTSNTDTPKTLFGKLSLYAKNIRKKYAPKTNPDSKELSEEQDDTKALDPAAEMLKDLPMDDTPVSPSKTVEIHTQADSKEASKNADTKNNVSKYEEKGSTPTEYDGMCPQTDVKNPLEKCHTKDDVSKYETKTATENQTDPKAHTSDQPATSNVTDQNHIVVAMTCNAVTGTSSEVARVQIYDLDMKPKSPGLGEVKGKIYSPDGEVTVVAAKDVNDVMVSSLVYCSEVSGDHKLELLFQEKQVSGQLGFTSFAEDFWHDAVLTFCGHTDVTIKCPYLELDKDVIYKEYKVSDAGKLSNECHKKLNNDKILKNYRGGISTNPLTSDIQYWEITADVMIKSGLLGLNMLLEAAVTERDVIDESFKLEGQKNAWGVTVAHCKKHDCVCMRSWGDGVANDHTELPIINKQEEIGFLHLGFLLIPEKSRLVIVDIKQNYLPIIIDGVDCNVQLWPAWSVYNTNLADVTIQIVCGDSVMIDSQRATYLRETLVDNADDKERTSSTMENVLQGLKGFGQRLWTPKF